MTYRTTLVVSGIDLEDDDAVAQIYGALVAFSWRSDGLRTLVSIYSDSDPIACAAKAARLIVMRFPCATVVGVDEDLVSISDIASRAGVSREAVRTWVEGSRGPGGFPLHEGSVGGGSRGATKVWIWPAVNRWLGGNYGLDDGYKYLEPAELTELEVELRQVFKTDVRQDFARVFATVVDTWRPTLHASSERWSSTVERAAVLPISGMRTKGPQ